MQSVPHILILAAGRGSRMRSAIPKVLQPALFRPMLHHVLDLAQGVSRKSLSVVVGHGEESVRQACRRYDVRYFRQAEQRGTAHAVLAAEGFLLSQQGDLLILSADVVLLRPASILQLLRRHQESGAAATVAVANQPDPRGYGRVIEAGGTIAEIKEEVDCSPQERGVTLVNGGIYCFALAPLLEALAKVGNANGKGEYYLTDAVRLIAASGEKAVSHLIADADELLGVNDFAALALAEAELRRRHNRELMLGGVRLLDPASAMISPDCRFGWDVVVGGGAIWRAARTPPARRPALPAPAQPRRSSPVALLIHWLRAALAAALAVPAFAAEEFRKPRIEFLTPATARLGSSDFIMRARGAGFGGSAVLRWNGADRVTAVSAPGALSAMILSSDVAQEGQARVTVYDPETGASEPVLIPVQGVAPAASGVRSPNPTPLVASLSPSSVKIGTPGVVLRIEGSGFTPLSAARWRGAARKTRYLGPTAVEAELLSEDLLAPGTAAVSVRNPLPGGGASAPAIFTIRASAGSELDKPQITPNPWRADIHEGLRITFENLALKSIIKIMTVRGGPIKTIPASSGAGTWDLTDQAGEPVSAGAYVYMISDGRKTVQGKLRVSR